MKEILDKLKLVVQALEQERGPILLFALFLREHPLERWDIVVSVPQLKSSERTSYEIIVSKIRQALTSAEMVQLSRVVILDTSDGAVSFLQEICPLTNGGFKEAPKDFSLEPLSEKFGFTIKKAYILRCQKLPSDTP